MPSFHALTWLVLPLAMLGAGEAIVVIAAYLGIRASNRAETAAGSRAEPATGGNGNSTSGSCTDRRTVDIDSVAVHASLGIWGDSSGPAFDSAQSGK